MPRSGGYVDNAMNRRLGRVGMSYGSAVHCAATGSVGPRYYVDNASNRALGRAGMQWGTSGDTGYGISHSPHTSKVLDTVVRHDERENEMLGISKHLEKQKATSPVAELTSTACKVKVCEKKRTILEEERDIDKANIQRLSQENEQLGEQLATLQHKLHIREQKVATLEEGKLVDKEKLNSLRIQLKTTQHNLKASGDKVFRLEGIAQLEKAQLHRSRQDIARLTDELNTKTCNLEISEQKVNTLEEMAFHLEIMNDMNAYIKNSGINSPVPTNKTDKSEPPPNHGIGILDAGCNEFASLELMSLFQESSYDHKTRTICKMAIEELKQTSGHDHSDGATLLKILAMIYTDQGKPKEAYNLQLVASLNDLAVMYGKRGEYKEAEHLCKVPWRSGRSSLGRNIRMWPFSSPTWQFCATRRAKMRRLRDIACRI